MMNLPRYPDDKSHAQIRSLPSTHAKQKPNSTRTVFLI